MPEKHKRQTAASGGGNEDLAVLVLYLHIIEMTDGIEALVSRQRPTPAELLLRSSWEALLYIEYIVEKDADYTRRSLAWTADHARRRLAFYETLDPSTSRGKEFKSIKSPIKEVRNLRKRVCREVRPTRTHGVEIHR